VPIINTLALAGTNLPGTLFWDYDGAMNHLPALHHLQWQNRFGAFIIRKSNYRIFRVANPAIRFQDCK
jgi:hypothetical protein